MRPTFWQRMDQLARKLTPFALTLLLVILGQVPWHLPGLAEVAPLLPLMAVYHWTIQRPDLLPAHAVFVIGLLTDLLSGGPIGVNTLVLLTVYGVIYSQRRFFIGKTFLITWLGFVFVSAAASVQAWLLVSALHVTLIRADAPVFQYLLTAALYPVPAWLFLRWQQVFLRAA
jgi:rod shape-determining protein MreD